MTRALALLVAVAVSGCTANGAVTGLTAAADQAPGVLNQVEMLKTDIVTAPIAGCVGMLQAVSGQIRALESGAPGIAVAPSAESTTMVSGVAPRAPSPPRSRAAPSPRPPRSSLTNPQSPSAASLQWEWEHSGRPFTGPRPVTVAAQ